MACEPVCSSKEKPRLKPCLAFALGIVLLATGCEVPSGLAQAKRQFDDFLLTLAGRPDLIGKAGSPTQAESISAQKNHANAELLHEVFRVVLLREPTTPGEFASLLSSLDQGASLEGVYNGMVHSDTYRQLEESHRGATPEALRMFAREMNFLQSEMAQPTHFTPEWAKPLAKAVEPTGAESDDSGSGGASPGAAGSDEAVNTLSFGNSGQPESPMAATHPSPEEISQIFVGASLFTLKRVFGDEALKLIDEKRSTPGPGQGEEALARWFSQWVVHMASLHVDFGLPQRNKPDAQFHYNWARSAAEDLLVWEVLNRVHRVLNFAASANMGKK